ncbi:hypothetical protein SRHO_G00212040 [Serrasalmus rhombeus]
MQRHVPSHYKLAMHTFGLLTSASTLAELDEMLLSCTVLFSSPCSSENVEKHFKNLQTMLTAFGVSTVNDSSIVAEDFEGITCQTPFQRHFNNVIKSAPLDLQGPPNVYYSGTFLTTLATHFLPQAALWTSLMLGDLGRHGEGVAYQQFSKRFSKISKKTTQPSEIRQQTVSFFSKLFESEQASAQGVEENFLHLEAKLTEWSAAVLEAELTEGELHEALGGMENGWAPGIDGLPPEFYKAFWSVLGQDVLEVLQASIREGKLPQSCQEGCPDHATKEGRPHYAEELALCGIVVCGL